jgi:hypothetical protein
MMESLRDKMYNHEVNPSPDCWEKISAELDNAELGHEFPVALYNMEVTPPAAAWEKVNAAINPNLKLLSGQFSETIDFFEICCSGDRCWADRICYNKAYHRHR